MQQTIFNFQATSMTNTFMKYVFRTICPLLEIQTATFYFNSISFESKLSVLVY